MPEATVGQPPIEEPSFAQSLRQLASNIQSLREYTTTLSPFLDATFHDFLKTNALTLSPLGLAFLALLEPDEAVDAEGLGLDDTLPPDNEDTSAFSKQVRRSLRNIQLPPGVSINRENNGGVTISFPGDSSAGHTFEDMVHRLMRVIGGRRLLRVSTLMVMASFVDWYLADLIRIRLTAFPESISSNNKQIAFADLMKIGTVEEARRFIMDKEIDEICRQDIVAIVRYFKEHAKVYTTDIENKWLDAVREIYERRNAWVHNGGRTSAQYFRKVPSNLVPDLTVGVEIPVTDDYLSHSMDTLEVFALLLGLELWKAIAPDDPDRVKILFDIGYQRMKEHRWVVACALYESIIGREQVDQANALMGRINVWLCRKNLGEGGAVRWEVEKYDWSATSKRFVIASRVLRDDLNGAADLLESSIPSEFTLHELEEAPLFQQLRETDRYRELLAVHKPAADTPS